MRRWLTAGADSAHRLRVEFTRAATELMGWRASLTGIAAQQFCVESMMPLTMSAKGMNISSMAQAMRGLKEAQLAQPLLGKGGDLRLADGRLAALAAARGELAGGISLVREGLKLSLANLGAENLTEDVLDGAIGQGSTVTPAHVLELAAVMAQAQHLRAGGMDGKESVVRALRESRRGQGDGDAAVQEGRADLPRPFQDLTVNIEAESVDSPWAPVSPAAGELPPTRVRGPLEGRLRSVQQAARAIRSAAKDLTAAESAGLWRTYLTCASDFSREELLAAGNAKAHARFITVATQMCKPLTLLAKWSAMSYEDKAEWLRGLALVHSRVYGMPPPDVVYTPAEDIPAWSLDDKGGQAAKIVLRPTHWDRQTPYDAVSHLMEALTSRCQARLVARDHGRSEDAGPADSKSRVPAAEPASAAEVIATLQALPIERSSIGVSVAQYLGDMRSVATRAQQIALGEETVREFFG